MTRNNFILFFIIIGLSFSCSNNSNDKNIEKSYHKNGNVEIKKYYNNNEIVYNKTYYRNGALKSIFKYNEGIKKEELTGYRKSYFKNSGALESEMYLVDGKINGEQKLYKSDGSLYIISNYVDNILVGEKKYYNSEGEIENFEFYDSHGKLIEDKNNNE